MYMLMLLYKNFNKTKYKTKKQMCRFWVLHGQNKLICVHVYGRWKHTNQGDPDGKIHHGCVTNIRQYTESNKYNQKRTSPVGPCLTLSSSNNPF